MTSFCRFEVGSSGKCLLLPFQHAWVSKDCFIFFMYRLGKCQSQFFAVTANSEFVLKQQLILFSGCCFSSGWSQEGLLEESLPSNALRLSPTTFVARPSSQNLWKWQSMFHFQNLQMLSKRWFLTLTASVVQEKKPLIILYVHRYLHEINRIIVSWFVRHCKLPQGSFLFWFWPDFLRFMGDLKDLLWRFTSSNFSQVNFSIIRFSSS